MAAWVWLVHVAVAAPALPTRTWVSSLGDNNNPCSRAQPCRTFAGAISKTMAGGEISVLDPGGYDTITITKSITIMAEGFEGSILAGGVNAITINAGATDVVTLSGLSFEGEGSGIAGIKINSAGAVNIRKCLIKGFQANPDAAGIIIDADPAASIVVSDCTISDNSSGIVLHSGQLFLDRVQLVQNKQSGLRSNGRVAIAVINGSTIAHNKGTGLDIVDNGRILSFRNNAVYGNGLDGKPTKTLPLN
jgi:hypothetical protein